MQPVKVLSEQPIHAIFPFIAFKYFYTIFARKMQAKIDGKVGFGL